VKAISSKRQAISSRRDSVEFIAYGLLLIAPEWLFGCDNLKT
jgi:hypothetical protein